MSTQDTFDRNWDFDVNVSGLNAPKGHGGVQPDKGYYKAKVTDMYVNSERNANRVVIKTEISEGPFAGAVVYGGINKPSGPDDKVRYFWRGFAESAGYTPAQLDAGGLTLGNSSFVGKVVHLFFAPKDDENEYPQTDFLAPAEWNQQRQVFMSSGGGSTNGAGKPTTSKSALGAASGGTSTKSEILAKLGVPQQ